ncbi:hypothetical protein [Flagellimonas baculiformis]|uniref:hypothetical protein n=1 Tax=Flagellimonas baculiformis TaxID=3067310 RepID=UPI00296F3FC3|nr:hypothetical protein [Muricauda sp. D6]
MKNLYATILFLSFFLLTGKSTYAQYELHYYNKQAAIDAEKADVSNRSTARLPVDLEPIGGGEGGNEFVFNLSFVNFNTLQLLESQIAYSQLARKEIDDWLKKQENTTLLKEMNRQMGKNYTSFATAQREYFKFYEGGKYGNGGPVLRAMDNSVKNGNWSKNWTDQAKGYQKDHLILNKWIECGYCDELRPFAMEVNSLGNYDNDSGPGPKFYASNFRDNALNSFGDAFYKSGLNKSLSAGLLAMAEDGNKLLTKISDKRVAHYRSLGWQAKVFQMSAYLISNNTNCPSPMLSCLPSQLAKYKPQMIWSDDILNEWAKEYSPSIPKAQYIFGDEYLQGQIKLLTTGSYGVWSRQAVIDKVEGEREALAKALLVAPDVNEICGGIQWNDIGDSFYSTLTGLRLKAGIVVLGVKIGPTTTYNIPDICVQMPNFERVGGKEIKIPSHRATTRLKLAWSAAVDAVAVDLAILNRDPTEAELTYYLTKNLNLLLTSFRVGSTATVGYCPGSVKSVVKFCKN